MAKLMAAATKMPASVSGVPSGAFKGNLKDVLHEKDDEQIREHREDPVQQEYG